MAKARQSTRPKSQSRLKTKPAPKLHLATATNGDSPLVGVIMGSDSDLGVMNGAIDCLRDFEIPFEVRVVSAHRTPDEMLEYAASADGRGLEVIIAGAGGAAHLPGMVAAATLLPVIGVPVNVTSLEGLDALLSVVQMPKGVPVATVAIDNAFNAGLLAARILANDDPSLRKKLEVFRAQQVEKVRKADARTRTNGSGKKRRK